ncbi:DMT family transporter [Nocardioides dongxiaopingii]|uniref:DMT family transporter n=1 Tax=Nocardioides sp. S-1144 TaxID=2582905 RepID=UPI00116312AC|nr:DMT family transporter [Nocardioides sp. S-1144]QDH10765.1 DMT family transporter [Nocardioides sp. S-1144]
MSSSRARAGLLQICLAGVLWGTGGLAVQVVRDHAPLSVLTISGWRTGLAAVVLLAAALVAGRLGEVRRLLRARPGRVAVVGLCTAAYQALYFASVVLVGVTVSTVVSLGLAPVLLVARDAVVARSRPRGVLPVLAALTGLVLVSTAAGPGETGPTPVLGVLAAVASGTAYAAATALGEPLARGSDPLALTAATTTVGAVGLVPVALLLGGPAGTSDPVALAVLVYLGTLTFALAYALLYAGLRTTSSSAAVVATLVEPVTAGLVAAVFLGERLGVLGVAGMVLVLSAIASLPRAGRAGRAGARGLPASGPVVGGPPGTTA